MTHDTACVSWTILLCFRWSYTEYETVHFRIAFSVSSFIVLRSRFPMCFYPTECLLVLVGGIWEGLGEWGGGGYGSLLVELDVQSFQSVLVACWK